MITITDIKSSHSTKKVVAKYGKLAYDECFGFVPLLALGGFKDVDHMDKVKVLEHIYLIY